MRLCVCASLVALLALGACTSAGPSSSPGTRTVEWFSYIAGEDIQGACRAGAPERYRFVYNAVYTEQVRTYDLAIGGAGSAGLLRSAVFSGKPISTRSLLDPLGGWRGEVSWESVAPEALAQIRAGLADAGFFAAPPAGKFLDSGDFYWVVNACISGRHHFNVFAAPAQPVGELGFFVHLLRHDRTGVAVNPVKPRSARAEDRQGPVTRVAAATRGPRFLLQVGERGLLIRPLG